MNITSPITCLVAARGTGKIQLILSLLQKIQNDYHEVYLISFTEIINQTYVDVIDWRYRFDSYSSEFHSKISNDLEKIEKYY